MGKKNCRKTAVAAVPGYGTIVTVKLETENGIIVECKAEGPKEYTLPAKEALKKIPVDIVKNQTFEVDAVSGATVTSEAVIKAAKIAYKEITGGKNEII